MPIVYSAVARGSVILAEFSVFTGNFGTVTKDFLAKMHNTEGKFTYTVDKHTFNFNVDQGFTYIAVADEATGRIVPMAFLDKLRGEFQPKYGEKGKTAAASSLSNSFGKRMKELMEHVTQFPEEYSKVAGVQKKVDEVKSIMSENIDIVLARGEKLDTLVDKTDSLMNEADRFVRTGRNLRRQMWWQNCKMKVVVAMAVLLLVLILFLLICFSGRNCLSRGSSN